MINNPLAHLEMRSDVQNLKLPLLTQLIKVDTWFKCNNYLSMLAKHSNRKKINTELLHINIDCQEILRVNTTKFLGVHIDKFVNFKYQIDHLTKKLSKYVGLFYKLLSHSLLYLLFTNPFRTSSELL